MGCLSGPRGYSTHPRVARLVLVRVRSYHHVIISQGKGEKGEAVADGNLGELKRDTVRREKRPYTQSTLGGLPRVRPVSRVAWRSPRYARECGLTALHAAGFFSRGPLLHQQHRRRPSMLSNFRHRRPPPPHLPLVPPRS